MEEKILTEYQFQLLNKIKDGDYLYDNHKRLEGLTTVLVELLSKDTELLYSIIDGYFGDERVINAITDYLKSQDQEESEPERVYVDPIVPDFIAEKLAEERYNTREILLNGTKPLEVEDTPEEKEEWEKKWEEFFLYVTNNKNWVDGRPEWKGNVYITLYNAMKDFIRQLLDERETKAFNEGVKEMEDSEQIQADWDIEELGNIVDKIVKKLDKLNKKK